MPFIIAEPCVSTCDTACVEVCPVDCIHWVDFEDLIKLKKRQLDSSINRGIPQMQSNKME